MLKQAQQAKKQLKKVQKEINRMVFKGSSEDESVVVTVNGKLEITNVELSDYFSSCCLLYTSQSPRDLSTSRMPSSA